MATIKFLRMERKLSSKSIDKQPIKIIHERITERMISTLQTKEEKLKKAAVPDHNEAEYVVEKIVGKQVVDGTIHYWIKWLGYPSSENSW